MNILPGSSVTANNLAVGNGIGAVGAIYQSGGTVVFKQAANTADFQLGNNSDIGSGANNGALYGQGYYGLSGGSVNVNETGIGSANGGNGLLEVSGGTFNDTGWLAPARGGNLGQLGVVNITNGVVFASSVNGSGVNGNWGTGQTMIVNVGGGTLSVGALQGINFRTAGSSGVVNFDNNSLTVTNFIGGTGSVVVNFNGGTVQATGQMPASSPSRASSIPAAGRSTMPVSTSQSRSPSWRPPAAV